MTLWSDGPLPQAKGTIRVSDGTQFRTLSAGANDQVLVADDAALTGLRWATLVDGAPSPLRVASLTARSTNWNESPPTSIDRPDGVESGDLLVCVLQTNRKHESPTVAGFSLVRTEGGGFTTRPTVSVFTKTATGSEPSTYAVNAGATGGATGPQLALTLLRIVGWGSVGPNSGVNNQANLQGNAIATVPGVTSDDGGMLILATAWANPVPADLTVPPGFMLVSEGEWERPWYYPSGVYILDVPPGPTGSQVVTAGLKTWFGDELVNDPKGTYHASVMLEIGLPA